MIWENPNDWGEPNFLELASLHIQQTECGQMVIAGDEIWKIRLDAALKEIEEKDEMISVLEEIIRDLKCELRDLAWFDSDGDHA
jgi:hypothetical protein